MPTRSKVLILLAAVLFVVATTSVASADHGYWSKHQHVIGEPSGSDYSAYAVVDAADAFDYAYSRLQVYHPSSTKIFDQSTTCYYLNEGCDNVKSPTKNWPQSGSHKVVSY